MSELRQRNVSDSPQKGENIQKGETVQKGETIQKDQLTSRKKAEKYVAAFAEVVPKFMKEPLLTGAPFIGQGVEALEKLTPYVQKAIKEFHKLVVILKPYRLELLTPALFGIIMCFFGGSFFLLIAAFEAYRISGWTKSYEACQSLYNNFITCMEVEEKDNKKDDDNNGVLDVIEISPQDLFQRKTLLFLKTVDPEVVASALTAINTGLMAVIATLKLQFAMAITLGTSIADTMQKPALKYLSVPLQKLLTADYERWAEPIIVYMVKCMAISVAWTLQRMLSAFHSAIRGGQMVTRNLMEYLSEMNILHINHKETNLDETLGYGLAVIGFVVQLSWGFKLPFLLSILLLPVSMAEYALTWMVNM